jgi:hypothetical protein
MPKECGGEGIARVLDGPEVMARVQTLSDIFVEKVWQGGVEKVAIVETVVLEYHDIGDEEGVLQLRVVHVAGLDATHGLEPPVELWEEVGRDVEGGRGETACEGSRVELAVEYPAGKAGVVRWVEEVIEMTASEHER